ncbi:hypothetical protein [Actinomadura yumaensis]|uniref:Uncharacterized protein n=1 Tax=Actinomadura yumaensis TaxID=111807 RepID=A0ABW2CPI3_9ACTN
MSAAVILSAAALAALPAAPAVHAADAAAPNSLTINSGTADGTRTAKINITYTCSNGSKALFQLNVRFSWGYPGAGASGPCDSASHTLDIPFTTTHNKVLKGDKATATVTLRRSQPQDQAGPLTVTKQITFE